MLNEEWMGFIIFVNNVNKFGDIFYDWIFCVGIFIGFVFIVLYFVFDFIYVEFFF